MVTVRWDEFLENLAKGVEATEQEDWPVEDHYFEDALGLVDGRFKRV